MEWHFGLTVTGVEPRDTVHGVRNTQAQSTILVYRSGMSKLISFPFRAFAKLKKFHTKNPGIFLAKPLNGYPAPYVL